MYNPRERGVNSPYLEGVGVRVEERVQAVSVGVRAEARLAGRCGNVADEESRLRRVRYRLEP